MAAGVARLAGVLSARSAWTVGNGSSDEPTGPLAFLALGPSGLECDMAAAAVRPPTPEKMTWKQRCADDVRDDREDPWSQVAAMERLKEVLPHVPIDTPTRPRFVESNNNHAWRIGNLFLGVCWRGDRDRFRREAELMGSVRSEVPTPEVLRLQRESSPGNCLATSLDNHCRISTARLKPSSGENS